MRIITKDELNLDPKLVKQLKESIFIYPTDTIYGIGCDATNSELVAKVREIKQSLRQPFSVIIPNKNMIYEFCETDENTKEYLDKLPGPYTIIMKVKKSFVAGNVNPTGDTIGIRIPDHWFYKIVKKMKVPVITTSANASGGDFMTSIEDLDPKMKKHVDFVVDDGEIKGKPSTLIDLSKEEVEVKER